MNDKYLNFELSDFLTDDVFVDWTLANHEDDAWEKWVQEHPDMISRIEEAQRAVLSLRFKEEPFDKSIKANLWDRIEASTSAKEVTLHSPRKRWLYAIAAAASIALLSIFYFQEQATIHNTSLAMTETILLPASSEVNLSELSKISYKENRWNSQRNVTLEGQGHFKVTKGVPFTVHTDNGSVQVLGTEFDVVSEDDIFQVFVTEGRVNVNSGVHEKILTKDMAFFKNPEFSGNYPITEFPKANSSFFIFENQALEKILQTIEWQYDVDIDHSAIDITQSYNYSFDSNESLSALIEQIGWTFRLKSTMDNDRIVLNPQ